MKTKQVLNVLVGAALSLSLSATAFAKTAPAANAAGLAVTLQLAGTPSATAALGQLQQAGIGSIAFQTPAEAVVWAGQHGVVITESDLQRNIPNLEAAKAVAVQAVTINNDTASDVFSLTSAVAGVSPEQCGLKAMTAPASSRETLTAGNAVQANLQEYAYTLAVAKPDQVNGALSSINGLVYTPQAADVAKGVNALLPALTAEVKKTGATACALRNAAQKVAAAAGRAVAEARALADSVAGACSLNFGVQPVADLATCS